MSICCSCASVAAWFQSPCGATSDCDHNRRTKHVDKLREVSIPVWGDFRLRLIAMRIRASPTIGPFQSPCGATSDCDYLLYNRGVSNQREVSIPVWGDFRLRRRRRPRCRDRCLSSCFNPRVGRLPIATPKLVMAAMRQAAEEFQSPCGATSDCDVCITFARDAMHAGSFNPRVGRLPIATRF